MSARTAERACRRSRAIAAFGFALLLAGCNLDARLFSPDRSIKGYLRDAYAGEVDFKLPASYDIPDSLVQVFTLDSKGPGESSATKIYGMYIGSTARIGRDTVILYCHGKRDHMDFYWPRAKLLANVGGKNRFGVMMLDYRGFGLSQGTPSEDGLYADVDAAVAWLKAHGLTSDRLVVYGFSMGSAPATRLTAQPRTMAPGKLILESPFASAATMIQDATVLGMPPEFFTTLKIDNAAEIRSVMQPLLWLHGVDDDFVSLHNGQMVFDNYHGARGTAVTVPGARHSDIEEVMGFDAYRGSILAFLTR